MINSISHTARIHSGYDSSQVLRTAAKSQITETDAMTTTVPKNFLENIRKFMNTPNDGATDTDSFFKNAAEIYAKELEAIKAEKLDKAEEMEKISSLNQSFKYHLKSKAISPVFLIESHETMNMGYSQFLKNNLNLDIIAPEFKEKDLNDLKKSESIIANHQKNADYLSKHRNILENYASIFYEEFINSIARSDLDTAYNKAISSSKDKLSEFGIEYDSLQNEVSNQMHKIHNNGYWFDYDLMLNKTVLYR